MPGSENSGRSGAAGEPDARARLHLVGESPAWRGAFDLVRRIARNDAPTLIEGETGTGKELVARAIHYMGPRRDFPFIPLNCGALPDTLLESEIFGHEKGAFTDARERRSGLVAEARGGTLFLDEMETMSARAQVVFLRFLQDQTYLPVGGRSLLTADVRIVAASNADLSTLVDRGRFRSDLLFRLRVMHVRLPPLRERIGDVALLARAFLARFSKIHGRPSVRLSVESIAALEAHAWPGNVRELESLLLREFLLREEDGGELDVTRSLRAAGPNVVSCAAAPFRSAKARAVAEFERTYLRELLQRARGNLSLAARLSQKDRGTLKRLVKKHGIQATDFRDEETPPSSERSESA